MTGRAKFAAEVQAAAQGTAISAAARQDKYQRALTRVYRMALQLAIWHLRPEEATRFGGPHSFWPEVVSDQEALAIMEGFHQQAIAEAAIAMAPMVAAQAAETGKFDQAAVMAMVQEQSARLVQAKVVDRFGSAEPLSRESLYRTMDVAVEVSINGMADRQQRIANAITILDVALRAGVEVNGMPLVQLAAEELGLGDALAPTADPNALFAGAMQAAAQRPDLVSPETAQGVVGAANVVNQATAAQAGGEAQDAQAQVAATE